MPFPASNGTIPLTLEAAWSQARVTAQQIQQQASSLVTQIPGGVSGQAIVNVCDYFAQLNALLTQYAAVPGLATYAQAQINNQNFDVAGAFNAMQAALQAVITWIVQNFPNNSGALIYASFNQTTGRAQYVTFNSTQLGPLSTLLSALVATID